MALNIDFTCAASAARRCPLPGFGSVMPCACALWHETTGVLSLHDVTLRIRNTLPEHPMIRLILCSAQGLLFWPVSTKGNRDLAPPETHPLA